MLKIENVSMAIEYLHTPKKRNGFNPRHEPFFSFFFYCYGYFS